MAGDESAHTPWVPAGLVPGGVYARVAVVGGPLLAEHAVTVVDDGARDAEIAGAWLAGHPDGEVHVYLYDGDTGECVHTLVVRA